VNTNTRSRLERDDLGLYLDAIAATPLLTAEDEVELARRIEAGLYAEKVLAGEVKTKTKATTEELEVIVREGQEAMQTFIQANLRLVVAVARKSARNTQMPLLDLIQEGNTGLIRAVEKFDYTKGYKFSTYATWWVRQAISRGVAHQGRIVRLPVHVAEQVSQLAAARRNLVRTLGREPRPDEVADALGYDLDKVVELLSYSIDHVSLDAPVDADSTTTLGDLVSTEDAPGPDALVLRAEEKRRMEQLLDRLDERSADIMRRRYGLADGSQEKLADIGTVWGITAERVRQLERAALQKMREEQQHELVAA
jgi:RNA polymerase sigma factor (sigma-70 family)